MLGSRAAEGIYRLGIWADSDSSWQDEDLGRIRDYQITIDVIPLSVLPDPSSPLITPGTIQDQIASLDSPHWFAFRAIQGADYTLSTSSDQPDDHLIQIIDRDGSVVADNNSGLLHRMDWVSPATGNFFLRIASADNSPYTFQMAEHIDDQPGQPVDVTLPAQITGSIDYDTYIDYATPSPSDQDLFRFHAVAGTTYVLVRNDDNRPELNILDKDRPILHDQPDFDWGASGRWTAPATGIYYLQVSGRNRARHRYTGPYSLSLIKAPPDEQSEGVFNLESGYTFTGRMSYRDDHYEFLLQVPRRQTYRFTGEMPPYTDLGLYNSDLGFGYGVEAHGNGKLSWTITLQRGEYNISLQSSSAGPFTLLAEPVAQAEPKPDQPDDTSTDDLSSTSTDSTDDPSDTEVAYYDSSIPMDDSQLPDSPTP